MQVHVAYMSNHGFEVYMFSLVASKSVSSLIGMFVSYVLLSLALLGCFVFFLMFAGQLCFSPNMLAYGVLTWLKKLGR